MSAIRNEVDPRIRAWTPRLERGFAEMIEAFEGFQVSNAFSSPSSVGGRYSGQHRTPGPGWVLVKDVLSDERSAKSLEAQHLGLSRVQLFKKAVPGESLHRFLAAGELPGSVDEVVARVSRIEHIKDWDKMFLGGEYLDDIHLPEDVELDDRDMLVGEPLRVAHAKYSLRIPILRDRDFVWVECLRSFEDDTHKGLKIVQVMSVEDPRMPPQPNYERGEIITSGWVVWPVADDPRRSHALYLVQVDPKGWIPKWVVNRVVTDDQIFFNLATALLVDRERARAEADAGSRSSDSRNDDKDT